MALWAVRLAGMTRYVVLAPQRIDLLHNWLKMVGIYAGMVAAQVVDLKAVGNRTDKVFPSPSVSFPVLAATNTEAAIAAGCTVSGPFPAVPDVDPGPEPLFGGDPRPAERIASPPPAAVVHVAPAAFPAGPVTAVD
jgi:hypothetical protein